MQTEEKKETIAICEAYSKLWYFFFEEHNLMLLNEHIDDIVKAVDQFKKEYNT
jgi:hypothetical protein